MPNRVTAAMVAKSAGVSAATVSLVVNGIHEGRVSPKRVAQVRMAIRELNYVVDPVASSLAKGSSNLVIFINPGVANPYFGEVITGIQEGLGPGYLLLIAAIAHDQGLDAAGVRELFGFRPAGLLITGSSVGLLKGFPEERPTIMLDSPHSGELPPSVNFDYSHGAEALADHLADRGHRKVAYLDASIPSPSFVMRRQYFYARAHLRGMEEPKLNEVSAAIDMGASAQAFHDARIAWRRSGVTAIVCATDIHAYGVLEEAHSLGIDVPGALAVAGFDDLPYSTVCRPSLTTVSLPGRHLGRVAATQLRELLEGKELTTAPPIDTRLIIRASTGARVSS